MHPSLKRSLARDWPLDPRGVHRRFYLSERSQPPPSKPTPPPPAPSAPKYSSVELISLTGR